MNIKVDNNINSNVKSKQSFKAGINSQNFRIDKQLQEIGNKIGLATDTIMIKGLSKIAPGCIKDISAEPAMNTKIVVAINDSTMPEKLRLTIHNVTEDFDDMPPLSNKNGDETAEQMIEKFLLEQVAQRDGFKKGSYLSFIA